MRRLTTFGNQKISKKPNILADRQCPAPHLPTPPPKKENPGINSQKVHTNKCRGFLVLSNLNEFLGFFRNVLSKIEDFDMKVIACFIQSFVFVSCTFVFVLLFGNMLLGQHVFLTITISHDISIIPAIFHDIMQIILDRLLVSI